MSRLRHKPATELHDSTRSTRFFWRLMRSCGRSIKLVAIQSRETPSRSCGVRSPTYPIRLSTASCSENRVTTRGRPKESEASANGDARTAAGMAAECGLNETHPLDAVVHVCKQNA